MVTDFEIYHSLPPLLCELGLQLAGLEEHFGLEENLDFGTMTGRPPVKPHTARGGHAGSRVAHHDDLARPQRIRRRPGQVPNAHAVTGVELRHGPPSFGSGSS